MIDNNLSDMITNYKVGSAELRETLDKLQETVSSASTVLVTVYIAQQHLCITDLHPVCPSACDIITLCAVCWPRSQLALQGFVLAHLQWKCCGAQNSSDWKDYGSDGQSVPDSCCLEVKPGCGNGTMTDTAKVHQQVKYIYFVLAVGVSGTVGNRMSPVIMTE